MNAELKQKNYMPYTPLCLLFHLGILLSQITCSIGSLGRLYGVILERNNCLAALFIIVIWILLSIYRTE